MMLRGGLSRGVVQGRRCIGASCSAARNFAAVEEKRGVWIAATLQHTEPQRSLANIQLTSKQWRVSVSMQSRSLCESDLIESSIWPCRGAVVGGAGRSGGCNTRKSNIAATQPLTVCVDGEICAQEASPPLPLPPGNAPQQREHTCFQVASMQPMHEGSADCGVPLLVCTGEGAPSPMLSLPLRPLPLPPMPLLCRTAIACTVI